LVINGRRLDATAPLQSDVPDGYGRLGFQPTGLSFATVGLLAGRWHGEERQADPRGKGGQVEEESGLTLTKRGTT
jgi:hypothetical protein